VARPKQRVLQHVMEDRSRAIVREALPPEWVVRDYRPDYGIDLAVDLFEAVPGKPRRWIALGESFLVQVKATEEVHPSTLRLRERANVERFPLHAGGSEAHEIEVARVRLDTSLLATVQAMGAAVPVLLFLVELSTRRIYFVCLNDLIDKLILPEDPQYAEKRSRTVHVPLRNEVEGARSASVRPLATYAKRAKLYAAFQKFAYQRHELEWALPAHHPSDEWTDEEARRVLGLVRHFLSIVLRYDFWTRMPEWGAIAWSANELITLNECLWQPGVEGDLEAIRSYLRREPSMTRSVPWVDSLDLHAAREEFFAHVTRVWDRLAGLGRIYEELGREWLLPTFAGTHQAEF
jgi:hypothetical protein